MMSFDLVFPEIARHATRVLTVKRAGEHLLPEGSYVFHELFCARPRCDCRRVLFHVSSTEQKQIVASISWGFRPPQSAVDSNTEQLYLDALNPQSALSIELFQIFRDLILPDAAYAQRLLLHYEMWKAVVDDPAHPLHPNLDGWTFDDLSHTPHASHPATVLRGVHKVGPNERCPCGSGRKFKACCRALGR